MRIADRLRAAILAFTETSLGPPTLALLVVAYLLWVLLF